RTFIFHIINVSVFVHFTLIRSSLYILFFFFFNDPATTEIYTLSLHDALPISEGDDLRDGIASIFLADVFDDVGAAVVGEIDIDRSEEHTSELQSRGHLVCRLLLEKKKNTLTKLSIQNCNNR